MLTQIFILLCGLFLILFSSNYLIEGAGVLARNKKMSEFMIGLLIVGFGASFPELVLTIIGSIHNNTDIVVGNVIGSNSANLGFILGISALITPLAVSKVNSKRDIPFLLMSTTLFLMFGLSEGGISRIEGIALVAWFAMYVFYLIKGEKEETINTNVPSTLAFATTETSVVIIIGSIIGLVTGAKWFMESATNLGSTLGISNKLVGIIILGVSSSLPELSVAISALSRKRTELALGYIVGSSIINILLIAGIASIIRPIGFGSVNIVDLVALSLCVVIAFISQHTYHKGTVTRIDGACLLVTFIAYAIMLFNV